MFSVILIVVSAVGLTVAIHGTVLWAIASKLANARLGPVPLVGGSVFLILLAHFAEIFVFAVGYHLAIDYAGSGILKGQFSGHFQEYIYFSLVSYTSLGLGDVYPYGPVRLITGIEALTGLLMIG